MQLSQKQKPFTLFFSPFLKCILSFEDFEKKKMTLIADVILKLWTPKNEVREIWMTAHLPYTLITEKVIESEKIFLRDIKSLKTVS